ncbi:MAG: hypothetical protein A3F78_14350 [Burkholderiales bacterium RIFCSPLOWO2_12_FULL_61_40]|nr:MAG: hypothetical protein A3F78_14350 [Burkholderiales bacterium RIFCSPLOWO2_12_FULL_61_40]
MFSLNLYKIDGEKIAAVVDQEWIHASGDLASEMLANGVVGDGRIEVMTALAAFDGWQFANTGLPFVGAVG